MFQYLGTVSTLYMTEVLFHSGNDRGALHTLELIEVLFPSGIDRGTFPLYGRNTLLVNWVTRAAPLRWVDG